MSELWSACPSLWSTRPTTGAGADCPADVTEENGQMTRSATWHDAARARERCIGAYERPAVV